MSEKKIVFKKMDEFVFKYVDQFKESQAYQNFRTQLSSLNDVQFKVTNQAISLILILIPLLLLSILLFINYSSNRDLDTKRDILNEINLFTTNQRSLQNTGRAIISGKSIDNKSSFQNIINNSISTAGSDITSLSILDFSSNPLESITKSNGVLKFNKLNTQVLANFLADLVDRNKFRVSNLLIKKKLKDNTVSGQIEVIHYSQQSIAK